MLLAEIAEIQGNLFPTGGGLYIVLMKIMFYLLLFPPEGGIYCEKRIKI